MKVYESELARAAESVRGARAALEGGRWRQARLEVRDALEECERVYRLLGGRVRCKGKRS